MGKGYARVGSSITQKGGDGGDEHGAVYGLAGQMPTSITSHRLQAIANVSKNKTIFLSKISYGERMLSKG